MNNKDKEKLNKAVPESFAEPGSSEAHECKPCLNDCREGLNNTEKSNTPFGVSDSVYRWSAVIFLALTMLWLFLLLSTCGAVPGVSPSVLQLIAAFPVGYAVVFFGEVYLGRFTLSTKCFIACGVVTVILNLTAVVYRIIFL